MKQFTIFYLLTSAWTAALLYLSRSATEQGNLWLVIIVALLIGFPALLAVLYTDTVTLIHRSTKFHRDGLLKRFTTSRILPTIFWSIWAIVFGFATVFWLSSTTQLEIVLLYLSIGILYLCYSLILKLTSSEMAAYHSKASAIRWARILAALIMTAVFSTATLIAENSSTPESLVTKFSVLADIAIDPQESYLVQVATKVFAYLQEFRSHLISIAETVTPWYVVAIAIGTFAFIFNFAFVISSFLIPCSEYRRVFSPLNTCPVPAQVPMSNTIFTSVILTLFFFLFLPIVSNLELLVRHKLLDREIVVDAEARILVFAEKIDTLLYKVGTHAEINEAIFESFREQHISVGEIRKKAKLAFEGMRQKVDLYLNHYYSLPAEYMRIIGAVSGTIEKQITDDLTNSLMNNRAVEDLDATIKTQLANQPKVFQNYTSRVSTILEKNRLQDPQGHVVIVASSTTDPLMSPPENAVLISLNQRMGTAGVGAIGGFIAAKVVSKIAAKGAIKLAAKAMAKLATSKMAGGAAGAAIGASIGSFFPVVGTAVGGVIGLATGLILGVSIDAALLQLEENYSRAEFKAQILEAIDEQEREFNAMLSI